MDGVERWSGALHYPQISGAVKYNYIGTSARHRDLLPPSYTLMQEPATQAATGSVRGAAAAAPTAFVEPRSGVDFHGQMAAVYFFDEGISTDQVINILITKQGGSDEETDGEIGTRRVMDSVSH